MKANELMLGDYLRLKASGIPVVVHAIDYDNNISNKHVVDFFFCEGECSGEARYNYQLDDFEPIPLTPEILEKNGFVWNTYHNSLQLVCGSTHIGWGFYPNCLSVSDWADDANNQISSLNCKFVHELQHALRLCGIEKEIEL